MMGFVQMVVDMDKGKGQNKIFERIFSTLGYDEYLYSGKSRMFVMSLFAPDELHISIGDALSTNLNSKALTMALENQLENHGVGDKDVEYEDFDLFLDHHGAIGSYDFAAINKTDEWLAVTLDMKNVNKIKGGGMLFTPTCGKVTTKVAPNSMQYLASCIAGPAQRDFVTDGYEATAQPCEPPSDDSDYDEDPQEEEMDA